MTEIIDFYSRFTADYIAWRKKHPEMADDEDKMEKVFSRQYQKWMTTPKKWLKGKTPFQYFSEIKDPGIYVSMFVAYVENDIEIPEALIDCLIECRREVYPLLRNILFISGKDDISLDALSEVRARIISLIDEMRLDHPYKQYVSLLLASSEPDSLTEAVCVALEEAEDSAAIKMLLLEAYPMSEGIAKECILDLLCGFEDDGTVYSILAEELKRDELELGFAAELAGKLGDERLLPILKTAFEDTRLDYMTHTYIRYAIERITGDELSEGDYTGDPSYDYLAALKDDEEKI